MMVFSLIRMEKQILKLLKTIKRVYMALLITKSAQQEITSIDQLPQKITNTMRNL